MPISVEVDPSFSGIISITTADYILNHVVEQEGFSVDEIHIVFGNDNLLSKLKKKFFKKDQLTDVIAFRLNEYKEKKVEGEIYISIPRAKENAETFGEPFSREVGRLIIHGGLHLLNHDDQTEAGKNIMTSKEEEYLNQCNWQDLISTPA
jgi:probable rRNA maturation factor